MILINIHVNIYVLILDVYRGQPAMRLASLQEHMLLWLSITLSRWTRWQIIGLAASEFAITESYTKNLLSFVWLQTSTQGGKAIDNRHCVKLFLGNFILKVEERGIFLNKECHQMLQHDFSANPAHFLMGGAEPCFIAIILIKNFLKEDESRQWLR